MWPEALSALHELRWPGAITPPAAELALAALVQAPVAPPAPGRLRQEAWAVAHRLGWAETYGAEYIALARLSRCPLLTLDGRLSRSASREVEFLFPTAL